MTADVKQATARPSAPGRRRLWAVGASLLISVAALVSAALALEVAGRRDVWTNVDFELYLLIGRRVRFGDWPTMLGGFWPIGYPLVLNWASAAGIDVLRAVHTISAASGAAVVVAASLLVRTVTRSWLLAVATSLIVASNYWLLVSSSGETNVLPSDALALIATLSLMAGVMHVRNGRRLLISAAVAGLLLGFSYLARFQVVVLLPAFALAIAVALPASWRRRLFGCALLAAGFALGASLEIVPSLLVHGHPLYNLNAKNLWLVLVAGGDYNRWSEAPDTISIFEVLRLAGWARIGEFFVGQLKLAAEQLFIWAPPFHYLIWAASLLVAFLPVGPLGARVLLAAVIGALLITTGLFRLEHRLFMLVSLIQLVAAIAVLNLLARGAFRAHPGLATAAHASVLAAPLTAMQIPGVVDFLAVPRNDAATVLSRELRAAGATEPHAVLTNNRFFHAADRPDHATFSFAPAPGDALSPNRSIEFLALGVREGAFQTDVRGVLPALTADRARFAPINDLGWAQLWCVVPCGQDRAIPLAVTYENGLTLASAAMNALGADARVALFWLAERPQTRSYKTSLRLIAPDGQTQWQEDFVPQRNTHPTPRWTPGSVVPDFYDIPYSRCPTCALMMIVYDEATLAPVRTGGGDEIVRLAAAAR